LNCLSHGIRLTVMLAAVAITVAGCADSRMSNATPNAASGAQASGEAPYHTSFGMTSDGPTTDVYTEIFGRRDNGNTAAAAPAALPPPQQAEAAPAPNQQVQPATASATNRQRTATSTANRQVQPAPPPVTAQVAQPPAAPQPPPEPDTPSAYGITSNGPTTDLYTELFGPRRRDGQ
jgi:hypothetical protein